MQYTFGGADAALFINGKQQRLVQSISWEKDLTTKQILGEITFLKIQDDPISFDDTEDLVITIVYNSDEGETALEILTGVNMLKEYSGVSIDDLVTQKVFTFEAYQHIDPHTIVD